MGLMSKPLSIFLGVTAFGLSSYGMYLYFYKEDEENSDYQDTFAKTSKFKTIELKLPKDIIPDLIGRSGSCIKEFQDQSNTRITFGDEEQGCEEVICTIIGSIEACHIAQNLIRDFIDNRRILESEDVWVMASSVGKIIGRGGQKIYEIRSLSGAQIKVNDDEAGLPSKRLTVKDKYIEYIREAKTAKAMMENLDKVFNRKSPLIRLFILRNILQLKCTGELQEHFMQVDGLPRDLEESGTREQINLAKSLIEEIVEEVEKSQQKIQESLARREPRLPPKSPENISSMESPRVERISPIPGYPDTQFEVYISAMVDPSRFWVQIVGPKATELDCLVEEMTEYYGLDENRNTHPLQEVKKGDLVAASFQYDNKWYRAEVLNVLEEDPTMKQAELYYVDYGDTDTVPCSDMYELRTDFLRLHFQAIECFLARVEPTGETWSEEAIDKFEEWTHVAQWKKLFAKMNGYSVREKTRAKREGSPVPGIDLYEFDEHDFDIGEELVKIGLAVYKKDEILNSSSRATSNSNISVASSS